MVKRQVFYSFHYERDNWRVQQVRQIRLYSDDNESGQKIVSSNEWEKVKRGGDNAIKQWINEAMEYRSCVIVLIGSETADRKWVKYEIEQAWKNGKGLFGIYIHNLKDRNGNISRQGRNPFDIVIDNIRLSNVIRCYNPNPQDAYNHIRNNLLKWVEEAIRSRKS